MTKANDELARDHEAKLAAMLADKPPTNYATMAFPTVLTSLWEEDGRPQHVRFLEMCEFAADAFRDSAGTDEALMQHRAAPHLLRYVLGALRSYAARGPSAAKTMARMNVLSHAMGLVGGNEANGKGGKWSVRRKGEYLATFSSAASAALRADKPWSVAYKVGLAAAYDAYLPSDAGTPNGTEKAEVEAKLKHLLSEHNYRESYE